ncbi:MAG: hypothetical protein JWN72_2618 [Thermoleophilia bacterium]|nr:hypothetical protein [Thermoleophilia bacterium]
MVATGPGFLPKTALVASRIAYYPFTVPQKMNDSATLVGASLNGAVAGINASIGSAYAALEPKGIAKWILPIFGKVQEATDHSTAIAARNKTVFWDPVSQGFEGIGRAVAGPGAYWYLKKAGMEAPTTDAIKAVLNMGLFKFPDGGGGEAPAPSQTPAPEPTGDAGGGADTQGTPPAETPPAETPAPGGGGDAAEGAAATSTAA